jgi:hypothetical protein
MESEPMLCSECGVAADPWGPAWRAYRADAEPVVVVFCPRCAKREFGPFRADIAADVGE